MPLKSVRIKKEYEPVCRQFLVNLLAAGYNITNPEGVDVTAQLIIDVGMDKEVKTDGKRGQGVR